MGVDVSRWMTGWMKVTDGNQVLYHADLSHTFTDVLIATETGEIPIPEVDKTVEPISEADENEPPIPEEGSAVAQW